MGMVGASEYNYTEMGENIACIISDRKQILSLSLSLSQSLSLRASRFPQQIMACKRYVCPRGLCW